MEVKGECAISVHYGIPFPQSATRGERKLKQTSRPADIPSDCPRCYTTTADFCFVLAPFVSSFLRQLIIDLAFQAY